MAFSPYLATYDKLPANHRVLETLIASLAPSRMTYKYASRCKQSITALNSRFPSNFRYQELFALTSQKLGRCSAKGGLKHGLSTRKALRSSTVSPRPTEATASQSSPSTPGRSAYSLSSSQSAVHTDWLIHLILSDRNTPSIGEKARGRPPHRTGPM